MSQQDESGGARTRRRAWQLFRWSGRANWLAWLFSTKAELAVVLAAASVVTAGAGLTLRDAVESRRVEKVQAPVERIGPDAQAFTISGRDEAGRLGRFQVLVMQKGIGWVHRSTTELAREGQTIAPDAITRDVLGGEVRGRLKAAEAVIAVGTASQEGEVTEETHRAGLRARQAAKWVEAALPASQPLWVLNLGQYRDPCAACETGDTSWQRPFMLVAVERLDPGADLGQALASALSGRSNLPSPSAYSTFGLTKVR